jgi:hypothetical protein
MFSLLCLAAGALIGYGAVKSGEFKEGGGLVLLVVMAAAVSLAAVAGALSALLPAFLAIWFGRLALFCVAFAVGAFFADRHRV